MCSDDRKDKERVVEINLKLDYVPPQFILILQVSFPYLMLS
jgi:hypothetical protein